MRPTRDDERAALEAAFATGRPFVGLRGHRHDPALDAFVPPTLARRLRIVPLGAEGHVLRVAAAEPEPDLSALARHAAGLEIAVAIAPAHEIDAILGPAPAEVGDVDEEGEPAERTAVVDGPAPVRHAAREQPGAVEQPPRRPVEEQPAAAGQPPRRPVEEQPAAVEQPPRRQPPATPATSVTPARRPLWPLVLLVLLAVAAVLVLVLMLTAAGDDGERGTSVTDAVAGTTRQPTAPALGTALPLTIAVPGGALPPALRAALPAGADVRPAASRAGALAALCDASATAAVLDGPPTGAERADAGCPVQTVGTLTVAATVLLAPSGGCVGAGRARALADRPGTLDAARRRAGARAARAARARPRARRAARRDPAAAGRIAARARDAAIAAFDARRRLRPLAVRAPGGRCVAPRPAALASGAYPLAHRTGVVTGPVGAPAGIAGAVAAAARRPRVTTVAVARVR